MIEVRTQVIDAHLADTVGRLLITVVPMLMAASSDMFIRSTDGQQIYKHFYIIAFRTPVRLVFITVVFSSRFIIRSIEISINNINLKIIR